MEIWLGYYLENGGVEGNYIVYSGYMICNVVVCKLVKKVIKLLNRYFLKIFFM